jgi:hypothetical protein
MRVAWALWTAALVSLIAPAASRADEIDFIRNQGLRANVSIDLSGVHDNLVVSAGELVWDWMTPTPDGFADVFYTYCIDLLNIVRDPQTVSVRSTTEYSNPMTAVDGINRAAYLFNRHAADVHLSGSATLAAALQVAIWETLYDGDTNLGSGNFVLNTTGAVRMAASGYLASLFEASGASYSSAATWLDAIGGQDQIMGSVSEPSTLLLLGTAMLFAAGRLRKPKRPRKTAD